MALPRHYVASPTFTPLPYGLLSALGPYVRSPDDPHWRRGVVFESLCAQASTTFDPCDAVTGTGSAPPPPAKTETAEMVTRGVTPFTVYADVNCSAPGFWDRAQEMIAETLARAEESAVELALWTGRASAGQPGSDGFQVVFPHLAADEEVIDPAVSTAGSVTLQTAAVEVSGTYDIVEGLGRLEDALAECYHGVGVIHVPRVLAPTLAEATLLIADGPRYRTPNGNIIVLGSGYDGSSPAGVSSATSAYIYATGGMFIYRGPVETTPDISTLDRDTNVVTVIAERTYAIGWECCHLAVNISLGGVVTGTPLGAG